MPFETTATLEVNWNNIKTFKVSVIGFEPTVPTRTAIDSL